MSLQTPIIIDKIKRIKKELDSSYDSLQDVGVLSGLSGVLLFQFYYSKLFDEPYGNNVQKEILRLCYDKINGGYESPTYCAGLAGMGWTLDHLYQHGFISEGNDEYFLDFESYLYKVMIKYISGSYYDFLHGALGIAFYFTKRLENTNSGKLRKEYKGYLLEFIQKLKYCSLQKSTGRSWLSWTSTGEKDVNFSLSHGISSIINFLSRLIEIDDFGTMPLQLLTDTIDFLTSNEIQHENSESVYPSWLKEKGALSRVAWCYGDLGIGLSLFKASLTLKDDDLKDKALDVLVKTSNRTDPEQSKVIDAGICHGAFGNALVFYKLFNKTKKSIFRETAEFWFNQGMEMGRFKDGLAGFKEWSNRENIWINSNTLLTGISGIGLVLIDYLSNFENNWDECLMINV